MAVLGQEHVTVAGAKRVQDLVVVEEVHSLKALQVLVLVEE